MGRHFGVKEGDLYYTMKHGLVQFDELPDWHGIEGIKFQVINTQTDPRIWYKGRDCSCYEVQDPMWEEYLHDGGNEDGDGFEGYMRFYSEKVKALCEYVLFPELHERATTEV